MLQKVGNIDDGVAYHKADDNCDHRLQNIQLYARQLGASCRPSRLLLLLNLSGVLTTWHGRHGNILTASGVPTDDLALTSDGVKYTRVAVREAGDRQGVVHQEPHDRKCLLHTNFKTEPMQEKIAIS